MSASRVAFGGLLDPEPAHAAVEIGPVRLEYSSGFRHVALGLGQCGGDEAAAADPVVARPDLLIVDYRLENGRNGVDAIVALRARFGAGVPAIVVTGSTMTGHDKEAQEQDFHLLLKPVVPNKLRAMIAFKLGVKARAA